MQKILRLLNRNRLLIFILVVAAVSRLWNVGGFLDFKGDEGRDLRVVSRFIKDFDLMFIGPRTSIGDMYLGPLYYYLISPALLLANFSPVGPAVFVCLIGVATVYLVWLIGKEWFGKAAGLVAASLYAISPVVIENSRDSWNPNVMPFFSLITMYSAWRALTTRRYSWLLVSAVSFAFALQSHYLGLLLLPTIGIMWLFTFWKQPKNRIKLSLFTLYAFTLFALLMSPIFIFDLKHNNQNINSFIIFFTHRQDTVSAKPWNAIPELWPIWKDNIVTRLLGGKE
ncbi:MAG: glycosyltransferase family 39 protein, partial [bacterium]|nr:glycosyltransferase family 39 protein [bacterium]